LSQPCKKNQKALKRRNQKAIGDSLLRKGRNQKAIGDSLLQKGRNQKNIGANLLQKKHNQKTNKNTTQIAGTLQAPAIFITLIRFETHGCFAFAAVFIRS
jgi:alpha-D-ribose 1-methylphosphonate 5-triphosphate synthase subunit PhnG